MVHGPLCIGSSNLLGFISPCSSSRTARSNGNGDVLEPGWGKVYLGRSTLLGNHPLLSLRAKVFPNRRAHHARRPTSATKDQDYHRHSSHSEAFANFKAGWWSWRVPASPVGGSLQRHGFRIRNPLLCWELLGQAFIPKLLAQIVKEFALEATRSQVPIGSFPPHPPEDCVIRIWLRRPKQILFAGDTTQEAHISNLCTYSNSNPALLKFSTGLLTAEWHLTFFLSPSRRGCSLEGTKA